MEGILAIIFIFGGGSAFLLSISPVGKAYAERIRAGTRAQQGGGTDPEVLAELDHMRAEIAELHERLDFTERLLAQRGEQGALRGE